MFTKTRLELIIEKPAFKRACRVLENAGVKGFTAFSAFAGYGANMQWQRGTDLSASRDMVMIISVMDEDLVTECAEKLENLIGTHIGLISFSEVKVFRDDKF
jgi:PII-like signaling protein